MTYRVVLTQQARDRIYEQARYIAQQQAPSIAASWLERILAAGESLAEMPRRYALALEDDFCPYEVRSLTIGQFVPLFTIVEEAKTVWIVGARHGFQLPQADDLPEDHDAFPRPPGES